MNTLNGYSSEGTTPQRGWDCDQTIKSYVRAVERLVRFHDMVHPKELDIDEVLDFLVSLNERDQVNWRTSKMYPDDDYQDKFGWTAVLLDTYVGR